MLTVNEGRKTEGEVVDLEGAAVARDSFKPPSMSFAGSQRDPEEESKDPATIMGRSSDSQMRLAIDYLSYEPDFLFKEFSDK